MRLAHPTSKGFTRGLAQRVSAKMDDIYIFFMCRENSLMHYPIHVEYIV